MTASEQTFAEIKHWLQLVRPLRVLNVVGDSAAPRSPTKDGLEAATLERNADWAKSLPCDLRPTIDETAAEDVPHLPEATYDLAFCEDALTEIPTGLGDSILRELRLRCRFVVARLSMASGLAWDADPTSWRRRDLARLPILASSNDAGRAFFLIRGGRSERVDTSRRQIVYLSPNREIRGGVKVLYNHVDILNSIGVQAVLAVREKRNLPASWWAWNPRNLAFHDRAATRTTRHDTVVIPEFRFREVSKYQHVACRLLFVQNPGLCFEMETWRWRGYDGVLTLGCPDGSKSKLHEFLESRTDIPIFPITNHYSDDPWGKASVDRVPGRILCLPRKGPEFVERLKREFDGIVTIDDASQLQMAVEYAKSDVYVHTGFPEGQPMPPIEAMLSGCVVCGFTGLGGLDVMHDGRTAYVADDGDYEQLAASLRKAIADTNRESVRKAGHELALRFHRSVAAAELETCFRDWVPSLAAKPRFPLGRLANRVLGIS